jgi:hypothetical protein
LAAREVIGSSNAAEDAVHEAECGRLGADLGHHGDEGDLADVGGFPGHVRAGENLEPGSFGIEFGVVRDEFDVG